MFRIFSQYKNNYLLDIKDETILYTSILRIEVLDENRNTKYLYFESKGVAINEIVWGIVLEEDYSIEIESNVESFLAFEDSIKNVNVITEDELKSFCQFLLIMTMKTLFIRLA
ncbi:MAG: hypothetical protein IPF69_15965 [Chitinophagaceae bacterium]|nr:hypothetical protein [Chitinophagaceae bacterium]